MKLTGSCLCAAVRIEINGVPISASHCHCRMCRKQHGAAFASYINIRPEQLRYLSGEEAVRVFHSSASVERRFCGRCGSSLEWTDRKDNPSQTAIALGIMDSKVPLKKIESIFIKDRADWLSEH